MKFKPGYRPHTPEEREAYFHGQVYSLLRIKESVNRMEFKAESLGSDEGSGFSLALFNVKAILKLALEEFTDED